MNEYSDRIMKEPGFARGMEIGAAGYVGVKDIYRERRLLGEEQWGFLYLGAAVQNAGKGHILAGTVLAEMASLRGVDLKDEGIRAMFVKALKKGEAAQDANFRSIPIKTVPWFPGTGQKPNAGRIGQYPSA